jgi:hypothetical protein
VKQREQSGARGRGRVAVEKEGEAEQGKMGRAVPLGARAEQRAEERRSKSSWGKAHRQAMAGYL